ncbi:hypothetical protein D9M70_622080 [compost metagenome]
MDCCSQPISIQLLLNDLLATPAWLTAGQIRLAVAINIEEFRNLGILELINTLDAVLVPGLLIDQITLQRTFREWTKFDHH